MDANSIEFLKIHICQRGFWESRHHRIWYAYIFEMLGAVLFVQIAPKIFWVILDLERESIVDKSYKIVKRIGTERTEKQINYD